MEPVYVVAFIGLMLLILSGAMDGRTYAVIFLIIAAFKLTGCGGDTPSGPTPNLTPRPSANEVASMSSVPRETCLSSPLVDQWKVGNTDVVVVGSDCLFESHLCQSIGYIDTPATTNIGIVEVEIVWEGMPYSFCLGTGRFRCAYDTNEYPYLQLDCQPDFTP